jgi:hypothetical protein
MKTQQQHQDQTPEHPQWTLQRYGRFWAVYDQGTLVVVTVYKKGALEVIQRLAPPRSTQPREETSDGGPHA